MNNIQQIMKMGQELQAKVRELQESLEKLPGDVPLKHFSRQEQLAYWLNLYNAVTLDLVLDGYPVDSIKDLGGVFSSPWKRDSRFCVLISGSSWMRSSTLSCRSTPGIPLSASS